MKKNEDQIKAYIAGYIDEAEAYKRGYDCGAKGANDWNCNFKIFSTPEKTKAWERGVNDAKYHKNQTTIHNERHKS